MNPNTKIASKKRAKAVKQEQDLKDFYERAFKGLRAPQNLKEELIGLERYLSNLESLHREYYQKWNDKSRFYSQSLYGITDEISMTTSQIVRTRIDILQSERLGL